MSWIVNLFDTDTRMNSGDLSVADRSKWTADELLPISFIGGFLRVFIPLIERFFFLSLCKQRWACCFQPSVEGLTVHHHALFTASSVFPLVVVTWDRRWVMQSAVGVCRRRWEELHDAAGQIDPHHYALLVYTDTNKAVLLEPQQRIFVGWYSVVPAVPLYRRWFGPVTASLTA